ncbi:hypothetical protein CgunFtcFv8_009088 [Champsocephalus gunnari]|uniref:Uncharacterized protein n=1 Tax=Champsocephalus gunnari TaxID=52237 RepID=A0AAN8D547_CHAGU|nr:hypothetical protein CgunFtcFv8_009088 [Champsocephalus gunnari]
MFDSGDVVGFSPGSGPGPGSFLSMDYYHRPPGLGTGEGAPPRGGGGPRAALRRPPGEPALERVQPL